MSLMLPDSALSNGDMSNKAGLDVQADESTDRQVSKVDGLEVGHRELRDRLEAFDASGTPAKRMRQWLLALIDSEPDWIDADSRTVSLSRKAVRRRSIAALCEVRSEGTVGEWLAVWRSEGWLRGEFVEVSRFLGEDAPVALKPSEARTSSAAILDVLLDHLGRAQGSDEELVDKLTGWVSEVVALECAGGTHVSAEVARGSSSCSRGSELVSSSKSSTTPNFSSDTVPRKRGGVPRRTVDDFNALVRPLAVLVEQRSLAPVTNTGNLVRVLEPYDDGEVESAVRAMCRHVRNDASVRSPFGLLYRAAQSGDAAFFGSCSSVNDGAPVAPRISPLDEIRGLRSTTPAANLAGLAIAREFLNKG